MDDGCPNFIKKFSKNMKKILKGKNYSDEDVTEEIISMVKEGHEQGVLLDSEAEMIHNIFEFGENEAKDIMTHRKNMIAIDGELSFTDAVDFMIENSKSRYPVYLDDVDHIIGVLHIKDALAFFKRNEVFRTAIKDIPELIREVDFVPETMNSHELFKMMQSAKNHMIMVIDEYGQTSGLVAMEDILEEIVGNIEDEYDEEVSMITQESEESYVMDGLTDFNEVVEILQLPLEENAFDTLNGLLISLIGRIPSEEEMPKISAYGYTFDIRKVEGNIIQEVYVRKTTQESN